MSRLSTKPLIKANGRKIHVNTNKQTFIWCWLNHHITGNIWMVMAVGRENVMAACCLTNWLFGCQRIWAKQRWPSRLRKQDKPEKSKRSRQIRHTWLWCSDISAPSTFTWKTQQKDIMRQKEGKRRMTWTKGLWGCVCVYKCTEDTQG